MGNMIVFFMTIRQTAESPDLCKKDAPSCFYGKSVFVSFCGHGAYFEGITQILARSGAAKIVLDGNAEYLLNSSFINLLREISPETVIEAAGKDSPLGGIDIFCGLFTGQADLARYELMWRNGIRDAAHLFLAHLSPATKKCVLTYSPKGHTSGPYSLRQRALDIAGSKKYLSGFITALSETPEDTRTLLRESDVAALSGFIMRAVETELSNAGSGLAAAYFISLTNGCGKPEQFTFGLNKEIVFKQLFSGYEAVLSPKARRDILALSCGTTERTSPYETSGILIGEKDESFKTIYVKTVRSASNVHLSGNNSILGIWAKSSEDKNTPDPGVIDYLKKNVNSDDLILVMNQKDRNISACVSTVNKISGIEPEAEGVSCDIGDISVSSGVRDIGLCFSGGGMRAIAFQLGCMRVLHRRGLLDRIKIISSVSGGSLIAALYLYASGSFEEFDDKVIKFLKRGLANRIFRRAFLSYRLFASIITFAVSGLLAFGADILRALLAFVARRFHRDTQDSGFRPEFIDRLHSPLRRWSSRISSFEDVLREEIFGTTRIQDMLKPGMDVVFNSSELRRAQPFRFSNIKSGCGLIGDIKGNHVTVSQAVSASSAYPLYFPAMDKIYEFIRPDGKVSRERVFLVDGGVYDNLGINCLLPEYLPQDNYNVFQADYIICCTAGQGDKKVIPHWVIPRLIRVSDIIGKKLIDVSREELEHAEADGKIKGYTIAHMAMQDSAFVSKPDDFIPKEKVECYPTNFWAMGSGDIDLVVKRGEQVMSMLMDRPSFDP